MDDGTDDSMDRSLRGGRARLGNTLSPREEEVVRLAREGKTNRDIALLLGISERTVEGHVRRSLRKLSTLKRLARGRKPGPLTRT